MLRAKWKQCWRNWAEKVVQVGKAGEEAGAQRSLQFLVPQGSFILTPPFSPSRTPPRLALIGKS